MKGRQRLCAVVLALGLAPKSAFAEASDRREILERLAANVVEACEETISAKPKTSMVVESVSALGTSLDHSEVQLVERRVTETLATKVVILDHGLSPRSEEPDVVLRVKLVETADRVDDDEENVLLSAEINLVDRKSSVTMAVKTVSVDYRHTMLRHSYPVRDAMSFALLTTSVISGTTALVLGIGASRASDEYVREQHTKQSGQVVDEKRRRRNQLYTATGAAVVGCALSYFLHYEIDNAPRDRSTRHRFDLSIESDGRAIGVLAEVKLH